MANWETDVTIVAPGVATTPGNGESVDLGTRDRLLRIVLSVTAASSGVTLSVSLESSPNGTDGWKAFGSFCPSGLGPSERVTLVSPQRYVRAKWTISGTSPSVTFGIVGLKGISFANLDDLDEHGMSAAALSFLTPTKRSEGLAAATEVASGLMAGTLTPPLSTWGTDITMNTCKLAAYELLSVRGFSPDGSDDNVRTRWEDAMKWFKSVGDGSISPVGVVDSGDSGDVGGAEVFTYEDRGWR